MIKMLKKGTTILLCALLIFQAGGMLCVYITKMMFQEIRQQKLLAQNNNSQERTFSTQDFRMACINEHEMIIDGKMHDFRITTKKNNQITVHLVADKKEDDLLHSISQFFSNEPSKKDSKDFPKQLIQWLKTPYLTVSCWQWNATDTTDLVYSLFCPQFCHDLIKDIIPLPPRA